MKRYNLSNDLEYDEDLKDFTGFMEESEDGEWVKHEDAVRLEKALRDIIKHLQISSNMHILSPVYQIAYRALNDETNPHKSV